MATSARVLFVCMGNICRSPTAEGVFRQLLLRDGLERRIITDSAGTHDYHVGKRPDARAQEAAAARGVDLSGLRARQVSVADFARYDWIMAMDNANLEQLQRLAPPSHRGRPQLFLNFASRHDEEEVPDPYYGGAHGFEHVLDLVEDAAEGLLQAILRRSK